MHFLIFLLTLSKQLRKDIDFFSNLIELSNMKAEISLFPWEQKVLQMQIKECIFYFLLLMNIHLYLLQIFVKYVPNHSSVVSVNIVYRAVFQWLSKVITRLFWFWF